MRAMLLMLAVVVSAIAAYLYFFLKRIGATFGVKTTNKWVKAGIALASIGLAAVSLNIAGFGAILILHIVFFALLVQLANFIVKKAAAAKYEKGFSVWKTIYGSGAIPLFLSAVVLLFGHWNLHNVVETHYTVYTHKDIRAQGYRVALIADVHFGVSLDREELLEKCAEISQTEPDVVVLCGDMVDNSTSAEEMRAVFNALGGIRSKYGVFYVHGNHDRPMAGLQSDYTEQELIDAITAGGITILQDSTAQIGEDMVLIGREDRSRERTGAGRASIEELLAGVDPDAFLLTLDHQPNQYAENGRAGTDLLLSGHTHGGQLFPLNYVQKIIKFNDGVYGHYRIDEDTQAIVTSGFAGWAYPVKTAAPSEYVIIDIKRQ